MSDAPSDIQELRARIDRALAETDNLLSESRKFAAESMKLAAEQRKLDAGQRKLDRDRAAAPWQIGIAFMTAGGALVGATVALVKVLG